MSQQLRHSSYKDLTKCDLITICYSWKTISQIMRKRRIWVKNSWAWSELPTFAISVAVSGISFAAEAFPVPNFVVEKKRKICSREETAKDRRITVKTMMKIPSNQSLAQMTHKIRTKSTSQKTIKI